MSGTTTKPAKILIVAEKYPPIVGGGETHIQNLAEGLLGHGYDVTVLTGEPPSEMDLGRYRTADVRIKYVEGFSQACRSLDAKAATASLYNQILSEDADLIHVYNHVPAMLLSWFRTDIRAKICLSLFETHVPGVRVFEMWRDQYRLERALQASLLINLDPDLVLCGSQAYRRWAIAAGAKEDRLAVVPFATEVARFLSGTSASREARNERQLKNEFLFLVPARLVPRKRVEDAVIALSMLIKRFPKTRLVLARPYQATDTEYINFVDALIAKRGVADYIIWERNRSWKEMPALYATANAIILPSSHEGFGIALIEAMAARRPVITTNVEGHDEVVTDTLTGYLYPDGDTEALASKMALVMTIDQTTVVDRAFTFVQQFHDTATMVASHMKAYSEVLLR